MSIFLSGGGGGGMGGRAGCAGLWIWAYAHYFSYLRLLERIFLMLILSFWFILKKKRISFSEPVFKLQYFSLFLRLLKIVSILFGNAHFSALLRYFESILRKKILSIYANISFCEHGHFSAYKQGRFSAYKQERFHAATHYHLTAKIFL